MKGVHTMKTKRIICHVLCLLLLAGLLPVRAAARVSVSRQSLRVNGKVVQCQKYNIDDRNYFMLRDLALLLKGTGSRFSVEWDGENRCVRLTSGEEYVPDGSELDLSLGDQSCSAVPSVQTIIIDGAERQDLTVYNIGDHNYFQLRELGDTLGFFVDYDEPSDTAIVISRAEAEPSPWVIREENRYLSDGMELHTLRTYDGDGRLLSWVEESGNSVWTELWTYDELGRPVKRIQETKAPKGDEVYSKETYAWEYDLWGNLVREFGVSGTGQDEVLYTYDERGNLLRRQNGELWTAYEYDNGDRLVRESSVGVDGDLSVTEYSRDELGRTVLERNLRNGAELSSTAYTWAGDLCLREVYTIAGHETVREYTYDDRGNLVLKKNIDPERTDTEQYAYDEAGRLLRREFRGGLYEWGEEYEFYTCEYDGAGRPLRETFENDRADTWSKEYAYNEAGDLARSVLVEWNKYRTETVYTYDPGAGRMTSVSTQTQAEAD